MSSAPPLLRNLLAQLLRHLLLVLAGLLGARMDSLRAMQAALPAGHRRRARFAAEIARLVRLRALLAEEDLLNDPGFLGKAAEVARMRNDAGRRALVRRRVHPTRYGLLRSARPAPPRAWHTPGGRCSSCMAIA